MNEEEYITDYITTLATADIELSGNTPAELRFNGTTSPGELYKLLLKKEAIVTRAICQTVLAAANNKMILSMVQQHLLDMKGTITFRDGHYTPPFPARDEKRCSPAPGTTGHSHPLPRGRLPAGGTGCLPPFTRVDERAASRPSLAAMPKRHRIGSCRDAIIPLRHGHRRMHA